MSSSKTRQLYLYLHPVPSCERWTSWSRVVASRSLQRTKYYLCILQHRYETWKIALSQGQKNVLCRLFCFCTQFASSFYYPSKKIKIIIAGRFYRYGQTVKGISLFVQYWYISDFFPLVRFPVYSPSPWIYIDCLLSPISYLYTRIHLELLGQNRVF